VYFADNLQEFATLNTVYEEILKLHIFIESRREYFQKGLITEDAAFYFAMYVGFMLV